MGWTQLAAIPVDRSWRYTPDTSAVWFRFVQEFPPYDIRFEVSQWDGEALWIEPDLVLSGYDKRLLYLPCPPVMSSTRKLGIRVEPSQPVLKDWALSIETSDFSMPLNNPTTATVTLPTAASATSATVPSATTITAIAAADSNRKGLTIWNNSTARLYLDHDGSVSATDFAVILEAGGFYEVPREYAPLQVSGIWAAANGNALVRTFV